jgi:hypothetical protein
VVAARRPAGRVASLIRALPLAVLVAILAAGCGSTKTVTVTVTKTTTKTKTVTVSRTAPQIGPPAVQWLYGHIESVARSDDGYLLSFDPAVLTSGITANAAAAAAEGTSCEPDQCAAVPNDNYTVDDGHQALVYRLPADVRGTVLTSGANLSGTQIDGDTLATIVGNGKAPGVTLFEPLDSGMWLEVRIDTIQTFHQQYHP